MYSFVKKTLKTNGELMIKMADGKTFELHLHNTTFEDTNNLIVIDAGHAKYWLNGDEVVYCWIHRHAVEEDED